MYSFKSLRSIIFISIKFGDNKNMILFILTMLLSHPNQYQPNDFNDNKQVNLTINIISEISRHQLAKARILDV
jgi:hypothetical protein